MKFLLYSWLQHIHVYSGFSPLSDRRSTTRGSFAISTSAAQPLPPGLYGATAAPQHDNSDILIPC